MNTDFNILKYIKNIFKILCPEGDNTKKFKRKFDLIIIDARKYHYKKTLK